MSRSSPSSTRRSFYETSSRFVTGFLIAVGCSAWPLAEGFAKPSTKAKAVCKGFLPPNDLYIPVGAFEAMGLSQTRFDWVLDRIEKVYAAKVRAQGGKLKVTRLWNDGEVNAYAERKGKTWSINMYGGMARHPLLNEEGFAMVACHELGHHIGGAPRYPNDWASNEGESDYFSTLKCLRYFYEGLDNESWFQSAKIDPVAEEKCSSQFSAREDQLICLRAAAGAQAIADVFADLDKVATPRFDTPSSRQVAKMDHNHPEAQCRLDTLFAGALCTVKKEVLIGDSDPRIGACNEGRDLFGWRPRCWFKP